jgi:protein phosphatase
VRAQHEDSFLVQHLAWSNRGERHEVALVVVADGMGGHEAGDRASGLVIRTVGGALAALLGGGLSGQFKGSTASVLAEALGAALKEANRVVQRAARDEAACMGMGATAAAALVWDGLAVIGHVGDCRVYHQRGGALTQVTRDQTLVARMVELGKLTPREALDHPARNEVAQAVGRQPELEPGRSQVQLALGDWLLVACDGLQAHLDARALQNETAQAPASAARLAQQLVDLADQRGGSDNCTVVAIRCC